MEESNSVTEGPPKKRCIFAAVGDVHGQFLKMVDEILEWEEVHKDDGWEVDFVLQVGDLEPHRHERDVASMAMPSKHRNLGDFHKLASGEVALPWPTYFIGGNHEPWEFLDQHEGHGFALGPDNLHFLGRSSVTQIGPLRVAALSGIDGANTYYEPRPHVSLFPYTRNKAYIHFNHADVESLLKEAKDGSETSKGEGLQHVQILLANIGVKAHVIEQITSGVARIRCIGDLLASTDESLRIAGIKDVPRKKITSSARSQVGRFSRDESAYGTDRCLNNSGNSDDESDGSFNEEKAAAFEGHTSTSTDAKPSAVAMCSRDGVVDILMTHDWPSGIDDPNRPCPIGERVRPLGNVTCRMLLEELSPTLMLCGHMHQAHTAVVGSSSVRCLAKVPASGSVAFFEVMHVTEDEGSRRRTIRELSRAKKE